MYAWYDYVCVSENATINFVYELMILPSPAQFFHQRGSTHQTSLQQPMKYTHMKTQLLRDKTVIDKYKRKKLS